MAMAIPFLRSCTRACLVPDGDALRTRVLGLDLSNPVGLAAGFDKDAEGYEALGALGFGFVEVGTLTARPQPGNARPRLFRLPRDRALINRMGFNNRGAANAVSRLKDHPKKCTVGVNIGKSKAATEAEAIDDYMASAEWLAPHADYLVVNVSSPNTPGLRDLQIVEKLRPLLEAVRSTAVRVCPDGPPPLLVKIAPDLADGDLDALADLALQLNLDGIIATNTTISRAGLRSSEDKVAACGEGGLSGAPLRDRSHAVLCRLRSRVGDRLTLIAAGGIETADDAWARIQAGATLVQIYTAFVYEGPWIARRIALGLAERARKAGFERVQDAVGCEVPGSDPDGSFLRR